MPRTAPSQLEHRPVFSWFRTHGDLIFTSGHAPVDPESLKVRPGDFESEARLTLQNLARSLQEAGSSMEKVLKVTVFLTDMSDYAALNAVYAEFFKGEAVPARSCVEVRRLPYNFRLEIEAVAHR